MFVKANVKGVVFEQAAVGKSDAQDKYGTVVLNTDIDDELMLEGMARDVVRHIQNMRKTIGLDVSERIVLSIDAADDNLRTAIERHMDTITDEALVDSMPDGSGELGHTETFKTNGLEFKVSMEKA